MALNGVDLEVYQGEIHALVGENGAGKSTLMNVLSAIVQADSGTIQLQGVPYRPSNPLEARRLGIAHIHQELSLCPHLSVAENIFLGTEHGFSQGGWIDRNKLHQAAGEILKQFHHPSIRPEKRVADLPIAAQQIVEICRALAQRASLILMDEPTSSLQRDDVEQLFEFITQLRNSGISVIYISHFLEEVRAIADRATVLRDGKSVLTGIMEETSNTALISAMVGRPMQDLFPPRVPAAPWECALKVESLATPSGVREAAFELRRGEILGIAGLIGSGRTELVRALFGLDKISAGTIHVLGEALPRNHSPSGAISKRLGYLSEDRKGEGLALNLSVTDNVTLTNLAACSHWGWIDLTKQREQAQASANTVKVKTSGTGAPVGSLSGGNQQKAALARLLHQDCEVFLLDEPTRGVDIGSKAQIYDLILALARSGKAVLMVSSYLPELFGVCDRLAVMNRGKLSAARPIEEWTPESVMQEATNS